MFKNSWILYVRSPSTQILNSNSFSIVVYAVIMGSAWSPTTPAQLSTSYSIVYPSQLVACFWLPSHFRATLWYAYSSPTVHLSLFPTHPVASNTIWQQQLWSAMGRRSIPVGKNKGRRMPWKSPSFPSTASGEFSFRHWFSGWNIFIQTFAKLNLQKFTKIQGMPSKQTRPIGFLIPPTVHQSQSPPLTPSHCSDRTRVVGVSTNRNGRDK